MRMRSPALLLAAGLVLAGCAGGRFVMRPMLSSPYRSAPHAVLIDDLDQASLLEAARLTRQYFRDSGKDQLRYRIGSRSIGRRELADSAEYIAALLERAGPGEAAALLSRSCESYTATEKAHFTAYYEPVLAASRLRDQRFRYPIYALPDLLTLAVVAGSSDERGEVPYPTREQIDGEGVLAGKGLELAWVDDPVALYFLHVQGSGRLEMRDGSTVRVGFAGSNELPYNSIGRYMIDNAIVGPGQGSSQGIRAYLRSHPETRDAIMFRNPRYIFFRELKVADGQGPLGSLGIPLVAGRSLATDKEFVPPGILIHIRTRRPVLDGQGRVASWTPLESFAFSHDAGAAIKGPARADIYWGSGERAGLEAGYLNLPGEFRLLLCGPSHA